MIPLNTDEHLGKRAFILFAVERMRWVLVLAAITIFLSIVRDAAQVPALRGAVSFLSKVVWLSIIFGLPYAWLLYKRSIFRIEEFGIKIKSGLIKKHEVMIPYRQIQSVNIIRTLAHQALGLSKLVMVTAGDREEKTDHEVEIVLEPVDKPLAEAIRDALQQKIGVQTVQHISHTAELDGKPLK